MMDVYPRERLVRHPDVHRLRARDTQAVSAMRGHTNTSYRISNLSACYRCNEKHCGCKEVEGNRDTVRDEANADMAARDG